MIQGTGRAWIELDMNNLRHNLSSLQNRLPDNCRLMASVKADAYGHGAAEICRELNSFGVRSFCVATAAEGVKLRKRHIKGKILVLGYTHPGQFHLLIKYGLTQTVLDLAYAESLNDFGGKFLVHIKIDTGLRRMGERSENLDAIIRIFEFENLIIEGIYTHFSAESSTEMAIKFTGKQLEHFNRLRAGIEKRGFAWPKAHAQSSFSILSGPDFGFDYARAGRALYGITSDFAGSGSYEAEFLPVLSLKARIGAVKTVFAGEYIGYAFKFKAPKDMKIAVLTIGYADGLPRSLSYGAGHVLIKGYRAPILGCVCMDQTMVDVTDIEKVERGDIAVAIGKSGELEIGHREAAEKAGTTATEFLSRLGPRLERIVIDGVSV